MDTPLNTLVTVCSHEQNIRKSRFLAQAIAVSDTAAALDFVQSVAAVEQGANHHCWAWRCGQDYRFNDDGEPSGSAGKPILAAIDGQTMDQVVVVVTRWFGGIKLGVGGLIRAYGGCAAECLRGGEQVPIIAMQRFVLGIGFAELPLLKARMKPWEAVIESENFGADGVTIRLSIPQQHADELDALLADLTRGQGTLRRRGRP